MFPKDLKGKEKSLRRLHLQFGHCPKKTMTKLLKLANAWFEKAPELLFKIIGQCKVHASTQLKNKIGSQQKVFEVGQQVYYKREQLKSSDSHLYRGPASLIGKRGKISWLVHKNKVIVCSATRLIPVENNEEERWIGLEKNGDFLRPVYEEDDGKIAKVDVENAILQSHELESKERCHLLLPEDLRKEGYCCELLRPVYGNSEACRKWWFLQEIGGVVSKLGLEVSSVRPEKKTESCNREEVSLLRHNVGCALWAAGATRPDCSWMACELSTQSNKIRRKVESTMAAEELIMLQAKDHRLRLDIAKLQEHVSKGLKLMHALGCSQIADPLIKRTASSALLLEWLNTGNLPEQCRKIVLDEVKK